MKVPSRFVRDICSAIRLPFSWNQLKRVDFLFKSGKETSVAALQKPVFEVKFSTSANPVFVEEISFMYRRDVESWVDFPLWWHIHGVGHSQSLIRAMHLYWVSMREEFKEVYAEDLDGEYRQAEFHPHYKKYLSEEDGEFRRECMHNQVPSVLFRRENI